MIEVVIAPEARDDLLAIVTYLAEVAGSQTASRWHDALWSAIDGIADFPGAGAPRPSLGKHVRINVVAPYIVVYEHGPGSAQDFVLRVLHGRRDVTRRLLGKQ